MSLSLQEAFSSLEDPRIERHKRHQLLDIIVLTICAVVSGAEGREAIEAFGKEKTRLAAAMDSVGKRNPLARLHCPPDVTVAGRGSQRLFQSLGAKCRQTDRGGSGCH